MLTNAWCLEDFFNVCKLMKFKKFKISQKKKTRQTRTLELDMTGVMPVYLQNLSVFGT